MLVILLNLLEFEKKVKVSVEGSCPMTSVQSDIMKRVPLLYTCIDREPAQCGVAGVIASVENFRCHLTVTVTLQLDSFDL
jgi:hypothetical protein